MTVRQQVNRNSPRVVAGIRRSFPLRSESQPPLFDSRALYGSAQDLQQIPPETIVQMQRAGGNRAMARLLRRSDDRPRSRRVPTTNHSTTIQRLYVIEDKGEEPVHYKQAPPDLDKYMRAGEHNGEPLYERLGALDMHYGLGSGDYIDENALIAKIKETYFSGSEPEMDEIVKKYESLTVKEKLPIHIALARQDKYPWRFIAQEQYGGSIMENITVDETDEAPVFKDFQKKWEKYFHPVFNKKKWKQSSHAYKSGMVHTVMNKARVRFHLDNMGGYKAIQEVLNKEGEHATAFTSEELRFVRRYWGDNRKLKIPGPTYWSRWHSEVGKFMQVYGVPTEDNMDILNEQLRENTTDATEEIALKDHVSFYKELQPVPAPWTTAYKQKWP